jgi:xanthine dehydrogenase accessory factor
VAFTSPFVVLRGAGDIATGVAWRLTRAGFVVIALELPQPLTVRRSVALSSAIYENEISIEEMRGIRASSLVAATDLAMSGTKESPCVPVLVAPTLEMLDFPLETCAVVDARLAKRNIDTTMNDGAVVVGLGPGFTAGVDVHAVIETNRGHHLGRVFWNGCAEPNTGVPGVVGGRGADRVLRAHSNGFVKWLRSIGDVVAEGETLGELAGQPILAPFNGLVRGLIHESVEIRAGLKIGDLDTRCERTACFEISDKALAIGGGVVEALLMRT